MATGHKHTEETKRKIGLAHKGKTLSEETRRKISIAHMGRQESAEAKLKMKLHYWYSPARQAIKRKSEVRKTLLKLERLERQKQRAARRELAKSINAFLYAERQRIKAEMGTKRFMTEETRRRISAAHKGRIPWNKGIKAWNHNKKWPVEVKENISRGMVAYWIQRKGNNNNTKQK